MVATDVARNLTFPPHRQFWEDTEDARGTPFADALCMGLSLSIVQPIMSIYENFVSDSDDDKTGW